MGVSTFDMESITPIWLKRTVMFIGLALTILGIPFAVNLFCIYPLSLVNNYRGDDMTRFGIISLMFVLCTLGAGIVALRHGNSAIKNEPSRLLRLPSPMLLFAIFLPALLMGIVFVEVGGGALFLPLILFVCAALPPLWAVAWMIPQSDSVLKAAPVDAPNAIGESNSWTLTWRRGLLAFLGGATLSALIAVLLEILIPTIVFSLVFNFTNAVSSDLQNLFRSLSNEQIARALTNPSFVFLFLQVAVIAPLAEEFAKPLVTLPLLKHLNRQHAFWLGALAGAGFAALENVVYATVGISIWAGILIVRSIGSALHPLGSGLVAVGWRDVLNNAPDAQANWWKRFGIAVAMHALWNGGSLLVITLGSAGFFGQMPRQLDIIGFSATGITLTLLLIVGIAALWIGRAYGHNQPLIRTGTLETPEPVDFLPSDRAVAIWALVCLMAIVPAGIAGIKLWLR